MNAEEAWEYVKNGGIVTMGGYTYYKDGYFAYGTYPGCLRGGDINEESFKKSNDWKPLTELDIIKRNGYKSDRFYSRIAKHNQVPCNIMDYLVEYLESNLLVCDYSNPCKNSALCKKFFDELEEN